MGILAGMVVAVMIVIMFGMVMLIVIMFIMIPMLMVLVVMIIMIVFCVMILIMICMVVIVIIMLIMVLFGLAIGHQGYARQGHGFDLGGRGRKGVELVSQKQFETFADPQDIIGIGQCPGIGWAQAVGMG